MTRVIPCSIFRSMLPSTKKPGSRFHIGNKARKRSFARKAKKLALSDFSVPGCPAVGEVKKVGIFGKKLEKKVGIFSQKVGKSSRLDTLLLKVDCVADNEGKKVGRAANTVQSGLDVAWRDVVVIKAAAWKEEG